MLGSFPSRRVFAAACALALLATGAAAKDAAPVDLNTASLKELEELPGVGEATAKKIVAGRPYSSVDDLAKAGVSKSTISKIRSQVTVAGAAPAGAPSSAAKPSAGKSAAAPAATKPASGPVDLNTASLKELEELPGVGEATAKKIVAGRPYSSVDDLSKAGVSKSTIEKLRPSATVSAAAARAPAAPPQAAPQARAPSSAPTPAPAPTPAAPSSPAASPPASAPPAAAAHASTSSKTAKLAPGQKINLNTAGKEELEMLPGIGPTKSQAIIDGRPFSKPEDVMKVKGIKEGTYAKIKDYIVVN